MKDYGEIVIRNLKQGLQDIGNNSDLIDDKLFENLCSRISNNYGSLSDAIQDAVYLEIPITYSDLYKEAQHYDEEIMEVIREGVSNDEKLFEVLQRGISRGYENGLYENLNNLGTYISYSKVIDFLEENKKEFNEICSKLENSDKDFGSIVEEIEEIAKKDSVLYFNEECDLSKKSNELSNYIDNLKKDLNQNKNMWSKQSKEDEFSR